MNEPKLCELCGKMSTGDYECKFCSEDFRDCCYDEEWDCCKKCADELRKAEKEVMETFLNGESGKTQVCNVDGMAEWVENE